MLNRCCVVLYWNNSYWSDFCTNMLIINIHNHWGSFTNYVIFENFYFFFVKCKTLLFMKCFLNFLENSGNLWKILNTFDKNIPLWSSCLLYLPQNSTTSKKENSWSHFHQNLQHFLEFSCIFQNFPEFFKKFQKFANIT